MPHYSEFLGITLLEPGQQQAHVTANEAFSSYDKAIAGIVDISLNGKTAYTLTSDFSIYNALRFSADRACIVTAPAVPKTWCVQNTSNFNITFIAAGQSTAPVVIAGNSTVQLLCDGLSVILISGQGSSGDVETAIATHNAAVGAHTAAINDQRPVLSANTTFYVRTTGTANGNGLTVATAVNSFTAAVALIRKYNSRGYSVTIDIGSGSWGAITITRNTFSNVDDVVIQGQADGSTIIDITSGTALSISDVGQSWIRFYNLHCRVTGAQTSNLIATFNCNRLGFYNFTLTGTGGTAFWIRATRFCDIGTAITLSGNFNRFLYADERSTIQCVNIPWNFIGDVNWVFAGVQSSNYSKINIQGCTFNYTGTITGQRYYINYYADLFTNNGGVNFIPGSVAGTVLANVYALYH